MAWRLAQRLPPGSHYAAALYPAAEWTTLEHLVASVVDAVETLRVQLVHLFAGKENQRLKPRLITRPGTTTGKWDGFKGTRLNDLNRMLRKG